MTKQKKAKRPTGGPIQVRLSADLVVRLERALESLVSQQHPATMGRGARGFTRSDCLRYALELGLAEIERAE